MQRHATSLTALAVAGAMAIAITPNASAQSSDGSVSAEVSGSSVNAAVDTLTSPVLDPITEGMSSTATESNPSLPAWAVAAEAGQFSGKTWYYMADGLTVTTDAEAAKGSPTGNAQVEMSLLDFAAATGRTVPASQVGPARLKHQAVVMDAEAAEALPDFAPGALAAEFDDKKWFYAADGFNVVSDETQVNTPTQGEFRTIWSLAQDTGKRLPENLVQRSLTMTTTTLSEVGGGASGSHGTSGSSTSPAFNFTLESLPAWAAGALVGKLDGQEWFYSKDFKYVVNKPELVNADVEVGNASWMSVIEFANKTQRSLPEALRGKLALEAGSSNPGAGIAANGSSASDLGNAAAIVLPAMLVIGGVAWYLNQDGKTFVTNLGRIGVTPTAQEIDASAHMLSSNRGEVEAQARAAAEAEAKGGAVTTVEAQAETRGISAATGSNAFGKGMIALLLASVLGAAVFAFGRRQLV
ncbi:hypothetical protein [Corynebacterium sp. HMSC29G08]|uniref:hypothetical protein n=1 Tax=Corynebacterium sp. HMSC29G08 TaxID=1581069 RepID=UPI0008A6610A|nr:hypothetical protein [Corynebacterium sp. HMSC29G08]OFT81460.1 hypothetical protein HMPREF3101_09985 [Corynebacterium sp. HMSC29G08]